jgi:hypothetical protein
MSNVAGGNASTAYSSEAGSNASPPGRASHPRSSPRPLGRPAANPIESGSSRTSTCSMIATRRPPGRLGISRGQSSKADWLIAGRPRSQKAVVPAVSWDAVMSASTQGRPSCVIRARTWLAERPPRNSSVSISTGPGSGECR